MYCRALALPQRNIVSTWESLVHHGPVVPECHRPWGPLPAHCEVVCLEKVLTQEGKNMVRLLTVELLNAVDECRVVVEYFKEGHRMGADLCLSVLVY